MPSRRTVNPHSVGARVATSVLVCSRPGRVLCKCFANRPRAGFCESLKPRAMSPQGEIVFRVPPRPLPEHCLPLCLHRGLDQAALYCKRGSLPVSACEHLCTVVLGHLHAHARMRLLACWGGRVCVCVRIRLTPSAAQVSLQELAEPPYCTLDSNLSVHRRRFPVASRGRNLRLHTIGPSWQGFCGFSWVIGGSSLS